MRSGDVDLLCFGDLEGDLDVLFRGDLERDLEREQDLERDCLGLEPDFERDLEWDRLRRGLLERERLSCFLGDCDPL